MGHLGLAFSFQDEVTLMLRMTHAGGDCRGKDEAQLKCTVQYDSVRCSTVFAFPLPPIGSLPFSLGMTEDEIALSVWRASPLPVAGSRIELYYG